MQIDWERCLNYLRGMLSDSVFKTYFAQTKMVNQTPPGDYQVVHVAAAEEMILVDSAKSERKAAKVVK